MFSIIPFFFFHKMAIWNALISSHKCHILEIFHSEFIPKQNLDPSHLFFSLKYSNTTVMLLKYL